MKITRIIVSLVGVLTAFTLVAVPADAAFAHQGTEDDHGGAATTAPENTAASGSPASSETQKADDTNTTNRQRTTAAEAKQRIVNRLDNAKKKVCENHQASIKTIMSNRITWAQNRIDLFATISGRTQQFYVKKGNALSNYDTLVAAANSAKATAQSGLDALRAAGTFDCNGDDPKGSIAAYKTAFDTEKDNLKAYRAAVKDLIAGVKSAQEDN